MRTMMKIAKKELQLLFYSPVAWLLLVLFIIQTAMVFTAKYESFLDANVWGNGMLSRVSGRIFMMGLWGVVQQYLYLYIPLLTMGLISHEFSSGSIKLLYSSPVSNAQIILGKFLSMVAYAGVMSGILLIYVIISWATVQDFEIAAVLTGWLGLFLLTCTYAAVGIFVSSLTSYQFVAALGTFLLLLGLGAVRNLWQEYDLIRDITYWLSISGRASTFVKGMLCSEDLLYFPLVTSLFLALSIIRLNALRQKVRFSVTFGRYAGVILVVCGIGYLSSRPSLMAYYDATTNKANTITKASQEIVEKLEGGLSITGYSNILSSGYGQTGFPFFIQQNRNLFQLYERFKPETKLKMVYYWDTITAQDQPGAAQSLAEQLKKKNMTLEQYAEEERKAKGLKPNRVKSREEIREMVDLTGERTFTWEIKRENGDRAFLRTYINDLTPWPSEAEISAAMKRLVMKVPTVGFVTGKGLRAPDDHSPQGYTTFAGEKHFRRSLLNQGFDVVKVDLSRPVPEEIDMLTIADMRTPLSEEQETNFQAYLDRGGNLFFMGEPRYRDVVNPFLEKYFGLQIEEGTLVQYRDSWLQPDALYTLFTPEAKEISYFFGQVWFVTMPTAGALKKVADCGYEVKPMLVSDTLAEEVRVREERSYRVWLEKESLNYIDSAIVYNPEAGEVDGEFNPGMFLTRKVGDKEQRIVVLGDADCISNGELGQKRAPTNPVLITGTYHYLSYGNMPVDMRRPSTNDTKVSIGKAGFKILHGGLLIFLPILCVGTGVFLWFRRRSS